MRILNSNSLAHQFFKFPFKLQYSILGYTAYIMLFEERACESIPSLLSTGIQTRPFLRCRFKEKYNPVRYHTNLPKTNCFKFQHVASTRPICYYKSQCTIIYSSFCFGIMCFPRPTIPVSTASASFVFQCFAMFSESGSSGFGALNSA